MAVGLPGLHRLPVRCPRQAVPGRVLELPGLPERDHHQQEAARHPGVPRPHRGPAGGPERRRLGAAARRHPRADPRPDPPGLPGRTHHRGQGDRRGRQPPEQPAAPDGRDRSPHMTAGARALLAAGAAGDPSPLRSAHVADDALVLAGRPARASAGPGPRFSDDTWDLSPACHTVNSKRAQSVLRFDKISDPLWRMTAKEYAYARLTPPGSRAARSARPRRRSPARSASWPGSSATLTGTGQACGCPASPATSSSTGSSPAAPPAPAGRPTSAPGTRGRSPCCTAWAASSPTTGSSTSRGRAGAHRQVAGRRARDENDTPRIPPHVLGPYLRGALFYVGAAPAEHLRRDRRARATVRLADGGTRRGA